MDDAHLPMEPEYVGAIMKLIVLVIIAIIGGLFVGSAILLVWIGLNLVAGIGNFFPDPAQHNHQVFICFATGAVISVVYVLNKSLGGTQPDWFNRKRVNRSTTNPLT